MPTTLTPLMTGILVHILCSYSLSSMCSEELWEIKKVDCESQQTAEDRLMLSTRFGLTAAISSYQSSPSSRLPEEMSCPTTAGICQLNLFKDNTTQRSV